MGDEISYVVCRNINFTNVCYVGCSFCGFARHKHEEDAYDRGLDDDARAARARPVERGASEVCIQGGIHPNKDGFWYRDDRARDQGASCPTCTSTRSRPRRSTSATSSRTGCRSRDYLAMLRDEGLGTIPGTAAEILDDEVRKILSPRKLMTERWVEIVTTAHEVGLRSSSTLMYGHIETPRAHRARTSS